ncbi:MAG: bifunctional isocitrate dehydrogenase kinase/phosphatase [Rugosibacter sp.]|nr:bifunctional isocitrate dehydrogenase kinase/phosphatase [Rugosibacter sp.]
MEKVLLLTAASFRGGDYSAVWQLDKELAIEHIISGDKLWKSFGVTRYSHIAFYDYDETEKMAECGLLKIHRTCGAVS